MAEVQSNEEHPEEQRKQSGQFDTFSSPSTPPQSSTSGGGRAACAAVSAVIFIVGIICLTVWLVFYRPHKPQFVVAGAAVYDLNATSPPFISTSVQFTLVARNPNRRLSVLCDGLSMRATYRDQIITPPLDLPPLQLGWKSRVVIAPVMGGPGIPVASEVVNGLRDDLSYGIVSMRVVLIGKLRWRTGAIKTGRYLLYVKCDVVLGIKKGYSGQIPLLAPSTCKVDL